MTIIMRTIRVGSRAHLTLLAFAAGALLATPALAQPAPAGGAPAARPGPAAAPAAPAPAPGAPGAPGAVPGAPAQPGASVTQTDIALPQAGPDPLAAALAPQPGGLTPEETAKRSLQVKSSVRVKQAELRAAQARVDQALVGFFPRVSVTASYTRLSEVDSGGLGGGGAILFSGTPGLIRVGEPGSCGPSDPTAACIIDATGNPVGAGSLSFPTPTTSLALTASIAVPISDYVLRLSQSYASASHAVSAKKLEEQAEILAAASDAKIAFFNWARAKGQAAVAAQAVVQARARVDDARITQSAGITSRADVLRLEAQVAAAEQVLAEASAFEAIAGEQLRIVIGAASGEPLTLGIDILSGDPAAGPAQSVEVLQQQALEKRLEIRALDETQHSLKSAVWAARASYAPRVDAVANLTYANPNQRIFPQQDEWRATWDAGVRLSWTINDTFTALGTVAEAKARVDVVAEQKAQIRDGLRLEVMSAYSDLQKARASIEAAARGVVAAEESLRVRRLLFRTGRATSLDLVDAETEATRAQLRRIDAHVGLLVAQAKLAHATGRDVKESSEGR